MFERFHFKTILIKNKKQNDAKSLILIKFKIMNIMHLQITEYYRKGVFISFYNKQRI